MSGVACFWHGHTTCTIFNGPQSKIKFWRKKITDNQTRDKKNKQKLLRSGWKVVTIWECQINKDVHREMNNLGKKLLE